MTLGIEDVRAHISLSGIASGYGVQLKRDGNEFVALCPFHTEDTPSFTIYTGKDGIQRFHCFGCGERGDIIDFVERIKGVSKAEAIRILGGGPAPKNVERRHVEAIDPYAGIEPIAPVSEIQQGEAIRLYNPKRAGTEHEWGRFVPSMVHPYRLRDGSLYGYVLRRSLRDGGKETPMVMWVRLPDGRECWSRFPFARPRPLYRLDRMRDGQVVVVEGEKCADFFARGWGRRSVVSWAGGVNGIPYVDWTPLAGRSVVLLPDADQPGLKAAHEIAEILLGLGCEIKLVDLPVAA